MRRSFSPSRTGALVLCGLLASASTAAAQWGPLQEQRADPQETEQVDPRTKEAKRLLHLQGGRILRLRSRWSGDHWEIRTGKAWQALPAGAVQSAALERDLVREAKTRSRRIPRADASADHAERTELTRWLVAAGLYDEAVEEINTILASAPNHAKSLELLHEGGIPLVVPRLGDATEEELGELLRFGAKASPAGREMAIAELDRHPDREALQAVLSGQLVSSSPLRRAFAAHSLRRLYKGELLRALLSRAILDPSDEVRRQASIALGDAEEPVVIVPTLRAMSSAHPKVRANAIEALGNMGYQAAVEPLVTTLLTSTTQRGQGVFPSPGSYIFTGRQRAYIQDFDVEVAQFQAVADPQVNVLIEGEVLDVRIQGATAKSFTTSERSAMRRSLQKLTGAEPGNTTRAWERWWEENKHRWGVESSTSEGRTASK